MGNIVSVRVNDKEQEILQRASEIHGCAVSTLMKRIVFDYLQNEYDLQVVREYEEQKDSGNLKTRPIDELWKELGI